MTDITFALASCQYPAGFLDREIAEASLRRLGKRLDAENDKLVPEFLLLVGDQVYVDATAGLFDPATRFDRFMTTYERFHDREGALQDLVRRMAVYMMLDDHEIEDNWEPGSGSKADENMEQGRRAYLAFQRRAGPPQILPEPSWDSKEPLWYTFERRGFPFFVADTRTERTARSAATVTDARIMSETQFKKLLCWLSEQDLDVPKFIASPAILLPRHLRAVQHGHPASALRSDAWDGYPYSLHRVLGYIATRRIRNVVFLSGDEHLSCVARASITPNGSNQPVDILSIHSSALHAPFPFANAITEDFAVPDEFSFSVSPQHISCEANGGPGFDWGGAYSCKVETDFAPPGDGFAVLRAVKEDRRWTMYCDFNRAADRRHALGDDHPMAFSLGDDGRVTKD